MTLSELSGEYLKEEEKLTRQIKSFTPEIHRLTGEDLYLARRRLMCLYEMRSDVRAVARKLENYYDKGDMRPVYRKHSQYFLSNCRLIVTFPIDKFITKLYNVSVTN